MMKRTLLLICIFTVSFSCVYAVNTAPIALGDTATTQENTDTTFNITTFTDLSTTPANDSDVDGVIDNATIDLDLYSLGGPQVNSTTAEGSWSVDVNGNLTFVPVMDFVGVATLDYSVCDDGVPVLCDTATIQITVISVNAAPVILPDHQTTPEDVSVSVCPPISDVDDPISALTVEACAPPLNGTITGPDVSGCYVYTPNQNFNGIDSFCAIVCDASSCDTTFNVITITPVNDSPVAVDDVNSTTQNTAVTLNIVTNDSDPNDPLGNIDNTTIDLNAYNISGVQNSYNNGDGLFSVDGSGNLTFTPSNNFVGSTSIDYIVCDDGNPLPVLCDTATITITVIAPLNIAPIAVDDNVSTLINTAIAIDVIANDTDNSSIDATSVSIITGAVNGNTTIDVITGQITYTPNTNFVGTETITYTVCDDGQPALPVLCSNAATVTITVSPLNVEGTILSSSSSPLQNSTVYLIVESTSQSGTILIASQTTTTDANGFYQFYNVPASFYIKAVPDLILHPSDLPTYYLNSGVFGYATSISPTVSLFVADFSTAAGLNPGGAGFVQGFVGQGAGKNSEAGDPVEGLEIVLVNASLDLVAHTTTDSEGNFEFSNLEASDYYVWGDNASVDNANAPLISLAVTPSQTDLMFTLEEEALVLNKTSKIKDLSQSSFKMYPNPNNGIINISSPALNADFNIELVNILGKMVYTESLNSNNVKINLLEKGLSKGTYILKLNTSKASFYSKVILN